MNTVHRVFIGVTDIKRFDHDGTDHRTKNIRVINNSNIVKRVGSTLHVEHVGLDHPMFSNPSGNRDP